MDASRRGDDRRQEGVTLALSRVALQIFMRERSVFMMIREVGLISPTHGISYVTLRYARPTRYRWTCARTSRQTVMVRIRTNSFLHFTTPSEEFPTGPGWTGGVGIPRRFLGEQTSLRLETRCK